MATKAKGNIVITTPTAQTMTPTRRVSLGNHQIPCAGAINDLKYSKGTTPKSNSIPRNTSGSKRKNISPSNGSSPEHKKQLIESKSPDQKEVVVGVDNGKESNDNDKPTEKDDLDNMDLRDLLKFSIRKNDKAMQEVNQKLDELKCELKEENKKIKEDLEAVKETVEEHSGAINFLSMKINDNADQMQQSKTELKDEIKTVRENCDNLRKTVKKCNDDNKAMKGRVATCEAKMDQLDSIPLQEAEEFPIERTLVMQNVLYSEPENITKVARGIIHKCLDLPSIEIVRAKRISVRDNGTELVKVVLKSNSDLIEVLRNKMKIKENRNADVSKIWILQSKSKAQLLMEQNTNTILRECNLDDILTRLPNGRIIRRSNRIARGQKTPNYSESTPRGYRRGRGRGSHTHVNSSYRRGNYTPGRGFQDIISPGNNINNSINASRSSRSSPNRAGPAVGIENPLDERIAQQHERLRLSENPDQLDPQTALSNE